MKRGLFVSLEGGDCVGKSTALPILADLFAREHSLLTYVTREPDTRLPYQHLLTPRGSEQDWRIIASAFALDRAVHSRSLLERLESGETVVCDRYLLSNIANTIARALAAGQSEADALAHLARVELPACVPDAVIVLDAPDAVLDERIAAREREGKASAADVAEWRGEMRRVYRESELVWMRFGAAWERARRTAGASRY